MHNSSTWFLLLGAIMMCGCASSRIIFTAKKANFPVSMSESFYDNDYNLLRKGDYEIVHRFSLKYSKFTINSIFPAKRVDLSEKFSDLVKKYNGDAIVNLTTETRPSKWNNSFDWLGSYVGLFTLGLIYPTNVVVNVNGEVVKILSKKTELFEKHENEFMVIYKSGKTTWFSRKN